MPYAFPIELIMQSVLNPKNNYANRVLKVNHAGEQGAINIYRGQALICRLFAPSLVAELDEFRSHEERHRDIFWNEMKCRGVRRCRSYWLCAIGGFALGVITALLGKSAIAATTVSVERVVLGHLKVQLEKLKDTDSAAFNAVTAIVQEEQLHHDQAKAQTLTGVLWPKIIGPVVSASTETVIWIGMRF